MCQTALISKNIVRLGTRSFEQNIEAVAGVAHTSGKLLRLNRSIDAFYDLLYEQFNDITAKDYKIFGPQLSLLLSSLKNLYKTYKKFPSEGNTVNEIERLGRNYAALCEIDSDIRQFRLNDKNDSSLDQALKEAVQVIDTLN